MIKSPIEAHVKTGKHIPSFKKQGAPGNSDFTGSVPGWYRNHSGEIGARAEASLIAFSFTPSSAAAGRVFSLLKALFGSNQDMALADYIQGSMMVRYHGSKRGTSF